MKKNLLIIAAAAISLSACTQSSWLRGAHRKTDFTNTTIDLNEIETFGSPYQSQAVVKPTFAPVSEVTGFDDTTPIASVVINGEARAYPLTFLASHIVNDMIAGTPVVVSYCTICNSTTVFDRRLDGSVLLFSSSGSVRKSDQLLIDQETETLWQKLTGEAIVGKYAGQKLNVIPGRLESFSKFKERFPKGKIMLAPFSRRAGAIAKLPDFLRRDNFVYFLDKRYGTSKNPGSDDAQQPFFFRGEYKAEDNDGLKGTTKLLTIYGVKDITWTLPYLQERGKIEYEGYTISWTPGMSSVLGGGKNTSSQDDGNIVVQKKDSAGKLVDVAYDTPYVAIFKSFYPEARIIK